MIFTSYRMEKNKIEKGKKTITILCYGNPGMEQPILKSENYIFDIRAISQGFTQEEYNRYVTDGEESDVVCLIDSDRIPVASLNQILPIFEKEQQKKAVFYISEKKRKHFMIGSAVNKDILYSPLLIGRKEELRKAYVGGDLLENPITAAAYSLQKSFVAFRTLNYSATVKPLSGLQVRQMKTLWSYLIKIPFRYLVSGDLFRHWGDLQGKTTRGMVCRMLMIFMAVFALIYMPYISKDYGISGDEIQYHEHSGYILDYYQKGDQSVFKPSQKYLQYYGIVVHTVSAAICRGVDIENYHEVRHGICAFIGALGMLFTGMLGLRLGGGVCGLLSILLMFFTPRFFGHSMNNLTDLPFAVGYLISVFYTIRLMDHYPVFRIRDMLGLALGILLALGTRSGGLIIYPMMLMYAGLFYILYYGIKEFYKFARYKIAIRNILLILVIVGIAGYILSILLWPYALQKPFSNVLASLKEFTNFSIGLRTIFEGQQMMSNMLPWHYAPKYLMIGMPVVTIVGFYGCLLYWVVKRKEFSLPAFFILFAAIFPVFWVVYQNSNLYGGIRHLLFVMPMMVVMAGKFWSSVMAVNLKGVKITMIVIFIAGLSLPAFHMIRNHPNDYVYFNELVGGLKGTYGNYETDYYYNSLKESADWFKQHVEIPKDKKITIVTSHSQNLSYYFRGDTNVRVIYSRYYEKYAKDWDYAIFANVYINKNQLQKGLFPPDGTIYSVKVDGFPMSAVVKRDTKEELEGFKYLKAGKQREALAVFEKYMQKHPHNEEILTQITKLHYMLNEPEKAKETGNEVIKLHPSLTENLYILTLTYLQGKDFKNAMASAQVILDENEHSADGYYLRALVYNGMEKYNEAIENINKVLSYRPEHDGALGLAADILYRNGSYKNAASTFEKLLKKKNDIQSMSMLADCYCRLKEYKQAEKLVSQINTLQPGYFPAYKVTLRMMLQKQEWMNAGAYLKPSEHINSDAELFVLRALYLDGVNQKGSALAMVQQALKIDKGNKEALELEKNWQKGSGPEAK